MDSAIFKAYDIRGHYPEQLDDESAYNIGRALVRFLSAKQIVVGRDMRTSSPALSAKLIEGLTIEGADVIDIGECTTPMVNFALANYGYDAAVMITASHNPSGDNGLKLVSQKGGPLDETWGIPDIKNLVTRGFGPGVANRGTVTTKDILTDYMSHILKFASDISDLKIVADYGNGMGAISAKPVFARLDVSCVDLFDAPDGDFPNHPANPHDVINFKDLQARVISEKADLGIFFDGDADRALFVDEKGALVPIDLLTVLLAQEELKTNPGEKVYFDLRFSKSVPNSIRKAGGVPIMMRVGNPFYKRALKEDGGILGAEFSGHLMFAENSRTDDGLFAAVKTMGMLTRLKKPLSVLIAEVSKYHASDEESYISPNPTTVADRLIAAFPSAKLVELDGTYLDLADGFVSVRRSQAEPELFRLRVEAKTLDELKERLKKTREIVQG